jgi:transposase-like protein
MVGRRRSDRERYWRGVLQRQGESGLSVADYCRQESVSAPSLYAWRRKLRERDAGAQRVDPQDGEAIPRAQLLPVRIEAETTSAPVRIFLPQGVSLDVPGSLDRRALVELLGALREAQLC